MGRRPRWPRRLTTRQTGEDNPTRHRLPVSPPRPPRGSARPDRRPDPLRPISERRRRRPTSRAAAGPRAGEAEPPSPPSDADASDEGEAPTGPTTARGRNKAAAILEQ